MRNVRHAPRQGYTSEVKQQYREHVWAGIRQILGREIGTKHALLMPSTEGKEIDVALKAGFRESHLHIVDHNPAIAANLKRMYPKINTYGVSLPRALERMIDQRIMLDAANFDWCYALSGTSVDLMTAITKHWVFNPKAAIGITVLRGREPKALTQALRMIQRQFQHRKLIMRKHPLKWEQGLPQEDAARITAIAAILSGEAKNPEGQVTANLAVPYKWGSYVSNNDAHHSMLWVVLETKQQAEDH